MSGLSKINFRSPVVWLAILLPAAFGLRFWVALLLPGYSFDEIVSVAVSARPLAEIWSYVGWEMHPPLHFYFLHFWFLLFGISEISVRCSSIFLSLAVVIVLFYLGREVFSSVRAGFYAALFYAFSPLFVFYGVTARMYTMLFLLSSLSFFFFLKMFAAGQRKKIRNGFFYAFFTIAALYTHLTAGLIVVIELFYLLCSLGGRKISVRELLKIFFLPALAVFFAYAPWFFWFLSHQAANLRNDAWYFTISGGGQLWLAVFYDLLRYLTTGNTYGAYLLAFSLAVLLVFFAFFRLAKTKYFWRIKVCFSAGHLFTLSIIGFSFVALFAAKLFVLRYAIIPAIGFFLILGRGLSCSGRQLKIILLLLFACLSFISYRDFARGPLLNDWKGAAEFIAKNEQTGDKIVASLYSSLLPLDFYYRGHLPAGAPLDSALAGKDLLSTVIRTNIYPTTDEKNVGQLDGFLADTRRIFFLASDGDGAFPDGIKISQDWLLSRGFHKVAVWPGSASGGSFFVWLMEKDK